MGVCWPPNLKFVYLGMEEIKVFDRGCAADTSGTSLAGYLNNVTYQELINALGRPTFDEPSGDDKTQVTWVLEFRGNVYTIYDWKTFDREYTENELTRWNIGSKVNAFDFIDAMERVIDESKEGI
jgi:hypothetical protein